MANQNDQGGLKPQVDCDGTILGQGVVAGTDMFQTKLNNNTFVLGTPGSGKTQSVVGLNVAQMNSSYVITDPKGTLMQEFGGMLEASGYRVECLDFTDPGRSCTFNPLAYVKDEEDIMSLAHAIIGEDRRASNDPFWDEAAEMLLAVLVAAVFASALDGAAPTFSDVFRLADARTYQPRHSPSLANRFEEMMEELRLGYRVDDDGKRHPFLSRNTKFRNMALKMWGRFRGITKVDTTSACIDMELQAVLNKLANESREYLFSNESPVDLAAIGKRRSALFLVVSDIDRAMDFMVSVFYSRLFKVLCELADKERKCFGGRLKVPVRVILDDFANQCRIADFDKIIAAVRSRDIWIMPICQSIGQLRSLYGDAAETIISCCDQQVYMGINDLTTARELCLRLNVPLEDIQSMPLGQEVVCIRGRKPQVVQRYDISTHQNAKFLVNDPGAEEYLVKGCPLYWQRGRERMAAQGGSRHVRGQGLQGRDDGLLPTA